MMIDFRSDTVTLPSKEMKTAMFDAAIGDDVFGEDPTVNALEEKAAAMLGHEAGLFCPSGTMTNQIAIRVHTKPGDEVICHETAHVYNYEGGGIARNSMASTHLIHNSGASMTASEVSDAILEDYDWLARTSLVVAEDTCNRGGGKCYDLNDLQEIGELCKQNNLAFHLDGARAFNAIVHKGHEIKKYGQLFDSVSICLSKGMGAPVGSVLLGTKAFIKEARRVRKTMGGGMRQAGFLAAAGIYALDHNIERLADDHARAMTLYHCLSGLPTVKSAIEPETNILIFDLESESEKTSALQELEAAGVLAVSFGKARIRIVTHLDITDQDIDHACAILKKVMG